MKAIKKTSNEKKTEMSAVITVMKTRGYDGEEEEEDSCANGDGGYEKGEVKEEEKKKRKEKREHGGTYGDSGVDKEEMEQK